ncbi:hypothetical protein ACR9PT_11420, partial [Piscirickettsia salmonis]|uniref:hypothetical protein n=1 Tax=Piscirickettsia salmonis TaxID=1238 RepID=UPI003EBB364B
HALPIDVQGFRETYPIIHPNIQGKFQLSAIKKAYYKEHGKTIDLLPKHLTADNLPSYELIQQFTGKGYSELRFHFSENLIQPRTVFIDADWFQLDHFRISDLKLSFYNRSEDYFKIKPISSQPTILSNERLKVAELIELANIKNHRIIKYDDLKLIISSLVPKHSIFHKAIQYIENISVINNNNFYNYSIETFSLIPEQKVVLKILLNHIQCLLQQLLPVGSQIKLSLKSN